METFSMLFESSPRVHFPVERRLSSEYIMAPICESESPSPFATAEICATEVLTEFNDTKCCCKPEKLVVLEGVQVAEPVVQPVEEPVRTPEEAVFIVPLPRAGEDTLISVPVPVPSPAPSPVPSPAPGPVPGPVPVPVPIPMLIPIPVPVPAATPTPPRRPVVAAEPIRELPVTYMDCEHPLYPWGSPTTSAPSNIESTPSMSTTMVARDISLPASILSPSPVPLSPVTSARSVRSAIPPLPGPSLISAPTPFQVFP